MPHRSRRLSAVGVVALVGGYLFGATGAPTPTATVRIHPAETSRLASESAPPTGAQCEQLFAVSCYEPAQLQKAYDEGPLLSAGVTGAGQTIAIVDAFGSPTITADLATFDQTFGLPAPPSLQIIQPAGPVPPYDPSNQDRVSWAGETTLDVEWAHAMAPGANILLVETPVAETEGPTGFPQIVEAENYVIDHHLAGIINQSFTATEETFPTPQSLYVLRTAYLNAAAHGVTVLAAAGDNGATGPEADSVTLYTHPVTTWPPSDPLVTGVGGTAVSLDAAGNRTGPDTVWNDSTNVAVNKFVYGNAGPNANAGGGGLSALFPRPWFQNADAAVVGDHRGVPDVAMSASCASGVDTYQSFGGLPPGWYVTCGTSEATPLFAGIVALADQVAGHPLGLLNPSLYALAEARAPGVVDVTQGNNTVSFVQGGTQVTVPGQSAQAGYDPVSGVGTVDAASFVPELAQVGRSHPGCPQEQRCDNDGDGDEGGGAAIGNPPPPGGGQPGDGDHDGDTGNTGNTGNNGGGQGTTGGQPAAGPGNNDGGHLLGDGHPPAGGPSNNDGGHLLGDGHPPAAGPGNNDGGQGTTGDQPHGGDGTHHGNTDGWSGLYLLAAGPPNGGNHHSNHHGGNHHGGNHHSNHHGGNHHGGNHHGGNHRGKHHGRHGADPGRHGHHPPRHPAED